MVFTTSSMSRWLTSVASVLLLLLFAVVTPPTPASPLSRLESRGLGRKRFGAAGPYLHIEIPKKPANPCIDTPTIENSASNTYRLGTLELTSASSSRVSPIAKGQSDLERESRPFNAVQKRNLLKMLVEKHLKKFSEKKHPSEAKIVRYWSNLVENEARPKIVEGQISNSESINKMAHLSTVGSSQLEVSESSSNPIDRLSQIDETSRQRIIEALKYWLDKVRKDDAQTTTSEGKISESETVATLKFETMTPEHHVDEGGSMSIPKSSINFPDQIDQIVKDDKTLGRKRWREAGAKFKAVRALNGISESAIQKADSVVYKTHGYLEKLDPFLELLEKFFGAAAALEEHIEMLEFYRTFKEIPNL